MSILWLAKRCPSRMSPKVKVAIFVIFLAVIGLQYFVSFLVYNNFNFATLSFNSFKKVLFVDTSLKNSSWPTDGSGASSEAKSNPVTGQPLNSVAKSLSASNGPTPVTTSQNGSADLPVCLLPKLVGRIKVFTENVPSLDELAQLHPELEPGGRWRPKNCKAEHKVAIVIPYRNREAHLRVFLHNVHDLLQKQRLDYAIIVVNQAPPTRFNRAMLMNIGFAEGIKLDNYQCFIFSDVDLIPEDDRNIYSCPAQPRHMSVSIDKFNYKLPYADIFGGVSALTTEQFRKVNGYANKFFGWGGEDDDMANRIKANGYKISRYPLAIARYKMISHKNDDGNRPNEQRFQMLRTGSQRFKTDGLNSLKYKLLGVELKPLFTWVNVEIDEKEVMKT